MKSFFNHPLRLLVGWMVAMAGLAHAQPAPPTVATLPASAVGITNATLNGMGNPSSELTFGLFQWGTTTNYGNLTPAQSLGSGGGNVPFNRGLTNLSVGVTYHFRAVVSNSFYVVTGTNQSFTTPVFVEASAGLPGVFQGSVAWGDYDNDGDLDLLLTGNAGTNASGLYISSIYRNNGNGTFTDIVAGLPGLTSSSAAWGDYDNDGDLDILLTGYGGTIPISRVYRNNGNGTFTDIVAGLPGVYFGSVAWGDYDNDGDLDILLTGYTGSVAISRIYRNDGNGTFTDIIAGLVAVDESSVAWGDYDNDGDLDILLQGYASSAPISRVYRNNGNGTFTDLGAGLPGGSSSEVAWGDYDNDGDLDILLAYGPAIYRNNGNGTFTDINADLGGYSTSAAWGDYDNDGDLDILLAGGNSAPFYSRVYRNNGNDTFTEIPVGLPGVLYSAVAWVDYDNDGDLDILLTGMTNTVTSERTSQLWRNNTMQANTPPTAPTGLGATAGNGLVTLSWNAATDAQTPAAGLSYNVRIGTTPGGSDVLAPSASVSGVRRLPQLGNAQQGLTAALRYNAGTPYYWSVQAVDSAFAGSAFSSGGSFRILQAPPLVALVTTTNLVTGDRNGDGVLDQSELNSVLTNYFSTSPFLRMTNVAGLGGTNVTFAFTNNLAGAFSVEYTTNLMDWLFLGPATPRYEFTDTNAPAVPQRYYRLRWP